MSSRHNKTVTVELRPVEAELLAQSRQRAGGLTQHPRGPPMSRQSVVSWLKALQLVWWGWSECSFGSLGAVPFEGPVQGCIYRWRVGLGPLEVRSAA